MENVSNWTRDYFLNNQEGCIERLNNLTVEERAALKHNLNFKENGNFVLINHFFVTDIKEPEFYCEKYELKKADGSVREESGKFCEKLNIELDEVVEDPAKNLGERQTCIISQSSNAWVREHEINPSNKRKIETNTDQDRYVVKVYGTSEIILNQLVEVIGFLYKTSSAVPMDTDDFGDENEPLPTYTVHAVVFKEQLHNNPLLLHGVDETTEDMQLLHDDMQRILTQFMFGDEVAARYLLCHLISHVYARVNDEVLGKFTLNLICPLVPLEILKEYTQNLYNVIECLMPNSLYVPLTIENLNTSSFVPKKDYARNRLSSGILQLPKSCHIVLDETQLENGKLDAGGCTAISDLSELIRNQQLSYDFQYYKIPYKTDVPVLIVSEGKSLLPSDFALPIKAVDADSVRLINESIKTGIHCIKPKLNSFRRYLTRCRLEKFDIEDEQTKMIESDFAKIRERNSNFQVENLHSLLVLSRLIGKSRGSKKLDGNSWEMAKKMEFERTARLERKNVTIEP